MGQVVADRRIILAAGLLSRIDNNLWIMPSLLGIGLLGFIAIGRADEACLADLG